MKFVIAGLGSAGQRHLRNLQRLVPDAEYTAWRVRGRDLVISDQQEAERRPPEAVYNLRVVHHLSEALAERPDAVIVANPISMHCDTALAAVQSGCSVFIEKPLADRWDGVESLLKISQRQDVVTMVGYQMRFHPVLRRVKQYLEDGRIGTPVSARLHWGEYLPGMHPYEDYRESHAARRLEGGGVILCLSHELDMAAWLFGMPSSVYVSGGHLSRLALDVEDTAEILLDCAWEGRRLPVSVSLNFVQRPTRRQGEIVGEEGTLRWDLVEPSVSLFRAADGEWECEEFRDFERNQLFLDEMAHFVGCLEGRERAEIGAVTGAKTLLVALAAKKSLDTGQAVAVDELSIGSATNA
jgi:predicted dehydrogenase